MKDKTGGIDMRLPDGGGRAGGKTAGREGGRGGRPSGRDFPQTGGGTADLRRRLIERLEADSLRRHVLLGFDGFIDDLCHVMDVCGEGRPAGRIGTISEFGRKVGDAAGLSRTMELEPRGLKTGGNAVNMGRAVLAFGNDLSLIATLGEDEIHPLFQDLAESCRAAVSIGEPGRTTALEFLDGKIMLTRAGGLSAVGWDSIARRMSADRLRTMVDTVSLIGLLDWTIFPRMDEIVYRFLDLISDLRVRPAIFFDLSDLRRVTRRDIVEMADIISCCGVSTQAMISLNEAESIIAADALSAGRDDTAARAGALRDRLGIDAVIIHPLMGAAVADPEGVWWVEGPYTPSPMISTGAGDNFNAGFCNGWLLNMAPDECAALGAYTSGYYVRNGRSPGKGELIDFIKSV